MKRKPILLLILIVAVPLCLLAGIGLRMAQQERLQIEQRMRRLLAERLGEIDRAIVGHFEELARDLQGLTSIDDYDPADLRQRIRDDSRLLQIFVIAPNDDLLHPDPNGLLNQGEREFLTQASQIIVDRELQRAAAAQSGSSAGGAEDTLDIVQPQAGTKHSVHSQSVPQASGWFVWYWARGLNLVYWNQRPSGHIVAAALNRSRWIADVIAALPDTPQAPTGVALDDASSRIRLINSTSHAVYQWGNFEPADNALPAGEITLSAPLASWRLQQFVPAERLAATAGSSTYFNLGLGLAAAALAMVALGYYLYREYARDMQEAGRRVSFVNQVSHELRTPLTNIRLYADLLDSDLDQLPGEVSARPKARLEVISSESQRLSRLIGNVLTFARQQRKTLKLNVRPGRVDAIVKEALERFRPSLEQVHIRVDFDPGAPGEVLVDADAVEQIVGNLINNVEKYAAGGEWIGITTAQQNSTTTISVADRGPGIEPASQPRVFEPFWRGSDSLHQAAGTGIGLTIVRELARLHGGEVGVTSHGQGACFRVELSTPSSNGNGDG